MFIIKVSIHAPARGATYLSSFILHNASRFNPRTRAGCDIMSQIAYSNSKEFQSTHPRGVRPAEIALSAGVIKFQSTHPRGVRLLVYSALRDMQAFQSTHPRGVRLVTLITCFIIRSFNPRTRAGCDDADGVEMPTIDEKFQSTHPRGVRLNLPL